MVAGRSAGGRCCAGGRRGGARRTVRVGGCRGFRKSREDGAGGGSVAGGTENSNKGSEGAGAGSGRGGSVGGGALAAIDCAGGPAFSGSCNPRFDGELSNSNMMC